MQYQTTLTYSQPMIRQAVWVFWRRVVGLGFPIAIALVAIGLITSIRNGDRSWVVGVLASVLALGILFLIALFPIHYRNSTQKLRAMKVWVKSDPGFYLFSSNTEVLSNSKSFSHSHSQ